MTKEKIQRNDGFVETRTLDANGHSNGYYEICKGDLCYEEGDLKNGKKDGVIEKHPNGDENKTILEYYKDDKKQILLSAFLKAITLGQTLVDKENKREEEELLNLKLKAFIGEKLLKEFLDKIAKWSKFDQFRESFLPRQKKSNHDLLAAASQKQLPSFQEKSPQNIDISKLAHRNRFER